MAMMIEGTSEGLRLLLWLLAVVTVAYELTHRSERTSPRREPRPRRWRRRLSRCLDVAALSIFAGVYWMLLSGVWLIIIGTAIAGGIVAAVLTWDLWPLGIVLVAGSILGLLATLVHFEVGLLLTLLSADAEGRIDTSEDALSDLLAWGVGPAVAIVVAIVVVLTW